MRLRTLSELQSKKSFKKDIVKDAQLTTIVNRMKQHFIWATVFVIVLSMLTYDLLALPYSWCTPWWRFVESVSSVVILFSLLYNLLSLTQLWITTNTLQLSPEHLQTLDLSKSCTPIDWVSNKWNHPQFHISPERDSEQSMSVWENSGYSNTSTSLIPHNSLYQVASSPEESKLELNQSTSTVAMASDV